MNTTEILEGVSFFREAPGALQTNMLAAARQVKLVPGERLFREGEIASGFVAIGRGSVRVFRLGASGREITLYHVHDQQTSLIATLSALLQRPAIATAQAELETEAVLLPASALREWVATSESMRTFIFETMTRALTDVATLLEDVAFRSMEGRLASLLLQHFATAPVINMRHEDIAAELGTAREVVSRLLETYERVGAIALSRGRIEPRDAAILRALCDSGH
ncbi:MAG TPA: Crp/Fnr family transcriptional regulator [Candidatus Limnocylindrales bacterium]|nr:Crp/Fnr family transcriptional regulator [Candidatus Limnocylindrales bacterium]